MAIAEGLTLEEFLALPDEELALEYEDGRITQKVPPMGQHSVVQLTIVELVNAYARGRRLALAFPELRTTFAGLSRVPDVSIYRWDRIPVAAGGKVANDFREAPDVAIEIVSPGQSVNYLVRRCLWYVEHAVAVALLVDPSDESVLLFRPNHTPVGLRGADRIGLADVLSGFDITVQQIFDALIIRPEAPDSSN